MKKLIFFLALSVSAFAAEKRVKDLGTTATSPASDDYTVIDGATNGTRRILTNNLIGNITGGVGTYGNATTAVTIAVDANGRITGITENSITGGGNVTNNATLASGNMVIGGGTTVIGTSNVTWNAGSNTLAVPVLTVGGSAQSGVNTGDQSLFGNIVVSGQTTVTANATAQNLTLVAGSNIVLTTNNTTKTVTINSTASGSGNVTNNATLASGNIIIGGGTTVVGTSAMSWNATNDTLTIGAAGVGNVTGNVATFDSLSITDFTTTNLTVSGNLVSTTVTDGQIYIGNNTGDRLTLATITAGNGTTVTNGAASITIAQKGFVREHFLTIDTVADGMNYGIMYTTEAITIVGIKGVHVGTLATPSVTATLKHGTDRTSGTTIEAVNITSSTGGTADDGTLADATVPAGSWIWVETSSKSGTTDNLELVVRYSHD